MIKSGKRAGLAIAASATALFISGCETTANKSARTEAIIACHGAKA